MDPVSALTTALGPLSQVVSFIWNCSSSYKVNREEVKAFTRHVEDMMRFLRAADSKLAREGAPPADAVLRVSKFTEKVAQLQKTIEALSKRSKVYRFLMHSSVSRQISGLYDDMDRTMRDFGLACAVDLLSAMNRQREEAKKLDTKSIQRDCEKIMQSRDILDGLGVRSAQMEEAKIALRKRLPSVPQSPERTVLELAMQETERRSRNFPTLPDQYVITSLECVWFPDKKLGSGGYASVYLGTYHGATVAVKVLNEDVPQTVMDAEVAIWMKLRHPNILQFYGCCSFAIPPFMVCEYKENGNINEYIRKHPGAPRRKLLYEATLGLIHLHNNDIIHGDLKGSNILVDRAGIACLADFGLSRVKTYSTTIGSPNTKNRIMQGTVRWMSPEQLRGGPPSKEGDIYSFAMTLYEVFTGVPPFSGLSDAGVQRTVCDNKMRPPRPHDSKIARLGLDDDLWALVTRCWHQSPTHRPPAGQLLNSLKPVLSPARPSQQRHIRRTASPEVIAGRRASHHQQPALSSSPPKHVEGVAHQRHRRASVSRPQASETRQPGPSAHVRQPSPRPPTKTPKAPKVNMHHSKPPPTQEVRVDDRRKTRPPSSPAAGPSHPQAVKETRPSQARFYHASNKSAENMIPVRAKGLPQQAQPLDAGAMLTPWPGVVFAVPGATQAVFPQPTILPQPTVHPQPTIRPVRSFSHLPGSTVMVDSGPLSTSFPGVQIGGGWTSWPV